jgi:predicted secreted Zn-dependent protease
MARSCADLSNMMSNHRKEQITADEVAVHDDERAIFERLQAQGYSLRRARRLARQDPRVIWDTMYIAEQRNERRHAAREE